MTDKMKEAIELLKQEEFYLRKTDRRSVWLSYNLGKTIHTKTMKALEERGIVKIELALVNNADMVAKLIDPDYEELTASKYCLRCVDSYESSLGRYKCRRTGEIVISTDGRATVNAMKCT